MRVIKRVGLVCAVVLAASVGTAQESGSDSDGGRSLMAEGMELFFKGLQDEMAPTLEGFSALLDEVGPGLQAFLEEMGPKLGSVFSKVEDWGAYHAPEMLPNGDIIMRKKAPDEMAEPEVDAPEAGESVDGIEL